MLWTEEELKSKVCKQHAHYVGRDPITSENKFHVTKIFCLGRQCMHLRKVTFDRGSRYYCGKSGDYHDHE